MAILEDHPGINVTLECRNQTMVEYDDEEAQWELKGKDFKGEVRSTEGSRISKYVKCESDSSFRIRVEISSPFKLNPKDSKVTGLSIWVYVDGQCIGGPSPQHAELVGTYSTTISKVSIRASPTEVCYYDLRFRAIKKVDVADNSRVMEDAKLIAGMGEITVLFHRTCRSSRAPKAHRSYKPLESTLPEEISEKALKGQALSHGVAFGTETRKRKRQSSSRLRYTYPDGLANPLAVFRFKYRSKEALQAELIIPRSPSPEPVRTPLESRNSNTAISSQERIAGLKREIVRIKEEETEAASGHKRSVTAEPLGVLRPEKRYKTDRKRDGRVVVDLTDD